MIRNEILAVAKPIIFNGEMVKAITAGIKKSTRRIVKPQPPIKNSEDGVYEMMDDGTFQMKINGYKNIYDYPVIPKYFEGDILYVPEAQSITRIKDLTTGNKFVYVTYKADGAERTFTNVSEKEWERLKMYDYGKKRFVSPYWTTKETANLFLRVTNVRVERLRDITVDDVLVEGVGHDIEVPAVCTTMPKKPQNFDAWPKEKQNDVISSYARSAYIGWCDYADKIFAGFKKVWDGTVKKSDLPQLGWDANPWVIVYDFEAIKEGIENGPLDADENEAEKKTE